MKHQHTDHEEIDSSAEFTAEFTDDLDPVDSVRQKEVRRKLEERMERRRLKQELEDYEGELDKDFDWDEFDKS